MSEELPVDPQGKMIVFGAKQIRRIWHDEQWFFSIVDIIGALTESDNPRDYWYRMKQREQESSGIELSTLCRQLKLASADGKSYKTDCVNTEAAFRIIQVFLEVPDLWYPKNLIRSNNQKWTQP